MHAFSAAAATAAATATATAPTAASSAGGNGKEEEEAEGLISAADFTAAMHKVGPSIVRGHSVELPPVTWDDIGGYDKLKRRLQQAVQWPLLHADAFRRLGLSAPRGVLLHGPPGCSKTMLARAAASTSGATFLPLSCAQVGGAACRGAGGLWGERVVWLVCWLTSSLIRGVVWIFISASFIKPPNAQPPPTKT
jgi:SpoVK/Ycf46/Vps4 family AAA+-type ATPase